jgi:hypothetical protein
MAMLPPAPEPAADTDPRLSRREALRTGGRVIAGSLGAALPISRVAASGASTPRVREPIRSCIFLLYYGGPSHLDTFDPKPDAPREIRGAYGTLPTRVPGLRVCEHLPMTARILDKIALVRSLHHPMTNHNSAAAETLTGRPPAGGDLELLADEAQTPPTLGSAVSHSLGARASELPHVALPWTLFNVVRLPGQTAGFLGAASERLQIEADPNADSFRVECLADGSDAQHGPGEKREALLRGLDRVRWPGAAGWTDYRERALRILSSETARRGFDVRREPESMRERYGRTSLGQSLLLARRLVEHGVNFVSVHDGMVNGQDANWDSHANIFDRHRTLLGISDRAFSALIEDLDARGLLASTLVVAVGEFGRTPRVNGSGGRDHWPGCYTAVLAGGGVQGGAAFGSSDRTGATPASEPVTPADLAATVFSRFGIDPAGEIRDQLDRPYRLADGTPIEGVMA